MSSWGGGWFTAAHQANNSNKPFLARRGSGDTILKRRFKALQINKKENMNLFPFRSFLSCPESLSEDRRGEDRLTKYFSDANLVNSVGCVWQTAPALHIPIHQEQLPGARLTRHHHHASHQNILPNWDQSIMKLSPTVCVLYPHWRNPGWALRH